MAYDSNKQKEETVDKFKILESNGENIMRFIDMLYKKNASREQALLSLSYYFSNSSCYVMDYSPVIRKEEIKKIFENNFKDDKKYTAYKKTSEFIKIEISKGNFPDVPMSSRIVRHAIEAKTECDQEDE